MKYDRIYFNSKNAVPDLLAYLKERLDDSTGFYETIGPMLQVQHFDKAKIIAKAGEMGLVAFWLQLGYARCFTTSVNEEGLPQEKTTDFCSPNKILVITESFFGGMPSKFNVQLSAGAVVVPFPRHAFDFLKSMAPGVEALANKILALDKPEGQEKTIMQGMKPRERYREFLRFFGVEIEQYFAIKHIASYLNMTPTFLSRLRGELYKNKTGLKKYLQTIFLILNLG